jgi:hypothetical protein
MRFQNDIHWTNDDDLVAEFVLQRLEPGEMERLGQHLQECAACNEVVMREKMVAAGAKLAARRGLKSRLQNRLAATAGARPGKHQSVQQTRERLPWPRILSAAAIVTIILAVGVYNDWFQTRYPGAVKSQPEIAQERAPSPIGGTRQSSDAANAAALKAKVEPGQQRGSGKQEDRPVTLHSTPPALNKDELRTHISTDEKEIASVMADQSIESDAAKKSGAASPSHLRGGRASEVQTSSRNEDSFSPRTDAVSNAGTLSVLTERRQDESPVSIWVEGTPSDRANVSGDIQPLAKTDEPSPRTKGLYQTLRGIGKSRVTSNQFLGNSVLVKQEPAEQLPRAQQSIQSVRGTIQTLLRSDKDTLHMTLFLDQPLSEAELRTARVETINQDSLVIFLAHQQIGYRLTPEIQSRVNMKARQVK